MTPHARLTAALAEHYPNARELRCSCGWQLPAHLSTFGNNFTAHLASVITSLEGVAVVELPETAGSVLIGGEPETVFAGTLDDIVISGFGCIYADEAPALAATLLSIHAQCTARAAEGGR